MSIKRIWGVFMRYFYFFSKLDNLSEVFYWPAIDILLWGMTSVWIQKSEGSGDLAIAILTALVLWQILWRSNYEITVNILQEFWNRNLVNLFSTPLKLSEWMCAVMLVGFVKIWITLLFSGFLVWLLFALNIFQVGWAIFPFIAMMTVSGWVIGLLSGGVMVYYGQRLQMLAWMAPFLFAPFSAIFYPVEALPKWGQVIAWCLPTTYVFEGMRKVLAGEIFSMHYFWMSMGLNAICLSLTMLFFKSMFEKSRRKGLSRLE